jgi:hypothetical protein
MGEPHCHCERSEAISCGTRLPWARRSRAFLTSANHGGRKSETSDLRRAPAMTGSASAPRRCAAVANSDESAAVLFLYFIQGSDGRVPLSLRAPGSPGQARGPLRAVRVQAPRSDRMRHAIAAGAPKSGVPDFGKSWWAQVGNIRLALRPRNDESASASRHCARHRRQLARGTCSSPVFSGARRLRPTSIWTFASRGRARRAAVIPLYFNARAAPGLRAPGSPPAAARGGGLGRCCVRRRRRFAGRLCAPGRRRGGA